MAVATMTSERVRFAAKVLEALPVAPDQPRGEGKVWEVAIIRAGTSMNGNHYPAEVLRASARLFEGVRVFDAHLTDQDYQSGRGRRPGGEYVGWIDTVRWDEAKQALMGNLHVADVAIREKMLTVWEAGRHDEFGLSIDAVVDQTPQAVSGAMVRHVSRFEKVSSVDLVFEPSAGGAIERLIEGRTTQEGSTSMDMKTIFQNLGSLTPEERQMIVGALASQITGEGQPPAAAPMADVAPAAPVAEEAPAPEPVAEAGKYASLDVLPASVKALPEDQQQAWMDEFNANFDSNGGDVLASAKAAWAKVKTMGAPAAAPKPAAAPAAAPKAPAPAMMGESMAGTATPPPAQMAAQESDLREIKLGLYQIRLEKQIKESRLPQQAQAFLIEQFSGAVRQPVEIARAVEGMRQTLASQTPARVSGAGITGGAPVFGMDNAEMALARLMGVAESYDQGMKAKMPGRMSLRDWYVSLTGDDEGMGTISSRRATEANVTTGSVVSVVKNVLNKSLAAEYVAAEDKRWWEPIVANYDQETINDVTVVQTGGIAALPSVNEGAAYTEMVWDDFEETGAFAKKGGFVGVTLETFMRDNLQALRRIPTGMMRTYVYTISDLVASTFTANSGDGPTLGTTSRALCNTTEGNKLTAALSFANAVAARTSFMKMGEFNTSRRLGTQPKFMVVPIDLESMATQVRDSDRDPDTVNNAVNVLKGKFDIVVVPPFTDTNNWYLMADPKEVEVISLHWYRGQRTPQLFSADAEQTGSLFTNDEIRYKVRFWVARVVSDWRGIVGNIVA